LVVRGVVVMGVVVGLLLVRLEVLMALVAAAVRQAQFLV
jgi:hypothetical protein